MDPALASPDGSPRTFLPPLRSPTSGGPRISRSPIIPLVVLTAVLVGALAFLTDGRATPPLGPPAASPAPPEPVSVETAPPDRPNAPPQPTSPGPSIERSPKVAHAPPQSFPDSQPVLDWLATLQLPDGSWPSTDRNRAEGITAAAALCFLARGETHQIGPHKSAVKGALRRLKTGQDPDGCVGVRAEARFNHPIATLTLQELYRATGSRLVKQASTRSLEFLATDTWRVLGEGWWGRVVPGEPWIPGAGAADSLWAVVSLGIARDQHVCALVLSETSKHLDAVLEATDAEALEDRAAWQEVASFARWLAATTKPAVRPSPRRWGRELIDPRERIEPAPGEFARPGTIGRELLLERRGDVLVILLRSIEPDPQRASGLPAVPLLRIDFGAGGRVVPPSEPMGRNSER